MNTSTKGVQEYRNGARRQEFQYIERQTLRCNSSQRSDDRATQDKGSDQWFKRIFLCHMRTDVRSQISLYPEEGLQVRQ